MKDTRNQVEDRIGYKPGDYINLRVDNDDFRGRIIKFIYEGKNDTIPTQALVEVCSVSRRVSGVSKSPVKVSLSSLSPLL